MDDAAARPYAWLDGPYVLRAGDRLRLDATGSYGVSAPITTYAWDYDGDGTTDETTAGPTVEHEYVDVQDVLTAVRVTDEQGRTAVANTHVLVTDGDEVPSSDDNCPDMASPDPHDQDADGVGDVCDPTAGYPT